jgi:hypothetical protein
VRNGWGSGAGGVSKILSTTICGFLRLAGNDNTSWDFKWPGASNEVEGVLRSRSCCEVENGDGGGGVS